MTARKIAWRGVVEEYRPFLPIQTGDPVVTLLEGGTPLIPAPRLSERVGAQVWLPSEKTKRVGPIRLLCYSCSERIVGDGHMRVRHSQLLRRHSLAGEGFDLAVGKAQGLLLVALDILNCFNFRL